MEFPSFYTVRINLDLLYVGSSLLQGPETLGETVD